MFSPNDGNITYIGRWSDTTFDTLPTKVAVGNGGKFRFKFTGASLVLNFRLTTEPEQPRISYSIDGGAFTTAAVVATKTLATGLSDSLHTAEIYCDSTYYHYDPAGDAWNTGEALMLQGITLAAGKMLSPWPTELPRVLAFGDSITEGLAALGSDGTEIVALSSGRRAWGNVLAGLVGAEVHVIGYGGQGVSKPGRRGVPTALLAYPYSMSGVAQTDPQAKVVIVAYGANDGLDSSSSFRDHYRAVLDAIRTDQPTAHFVLFPPFSLATFHQADIAAVAAEPAYSGFCTYVDVSGWSVSTSEDVHPDVAGHVAIAGYLAPFVIPYIDSIAPTISAFTIPPASTSLTVPITTLTATDDTAVTGYLITESITAPLASDAGWSSTPQTEYTFATPGSKILYAWAKDAAGNVSAGVSADVVITVGTTDTSIKHIDGTQVGAVKHVNGSASGAIKRKVGGSWQ